MKKITTSLLALFIGAIIMMAAPGDETPLMPSQINEIRVEHSVTKSGKEKTEYLVIYTDNQGKRRLSYMTASDYKKVEQAKKYSVDIEYYLKETKSGKYKVIVK